MEQVNETGNECLLLAFATHAIQRIYLSVNGKKRGMPPLMVSDHIMLKPYVNKRSKGINKTR